LSTLARHFIRELDSENRLIANIRLASARRSYRLHEPTFQPPTLSQSCDLVPWQESNVGHLVSVPCSRAAITSRAASWWRCRIFRDPNMVASSASPGVHNYNAHDHTLPILVRIPERFLKALIFPPRLAPGGGWGRRPEVGVDEPCGSSTP